jgi:micrococcal nuclease
VRRIEEPDAGDQHRRERSIRAAMTTRLTALLATALALAACTAGATPATTASNSATAGEVIRVVDGDTLVVMTGGEQKTVRVIGIDTPETKKPQTPVECGGRAATDSMWRLAPPGQKVTLRTDPTQDTEDRYGRLLAYITTRPEGRKSRVDVGREQVRLGHATVYVYRKPFGRVDGYRDAERVARTRHRGVWGQCDGDFHRPA